MRHAMILSALLLAAGPAMAQTRPVAPPVAPDVITNLAACLDIAADAERLACYDAQARPLVEASRTGDLVAVNRAEVREMERESFGLSLGGVGRLADRLIPSGDDQGGRLERLESTIRAAHQYEPNKYRFTLENGQVWEQTTSAEFFNPTRLEGKPAEVRSGALGSWQMRIDGGASVRVRRTE